MPIKGLLPGMAVHMAECCHPIPGDRIVGIVTKGKGIMVHTIDCEVLDNFSSEPDRWVDLSWDASVADPGVHVARLKTRLVNEAGAMGILCTVIATRKGNISNLKIIERNPSYFDVIVDIEVRDLDHITVIAAALRKETLINDVERLRA